MIRKNITLAIGLLLGVFGYAQNTVTGTVTDTNQSPLPGVTVLIVGTTKGVSTDFDGKYTIQVSENNQLEFSYVGMTSKIIKVTSSIIDVQLSEDASKLEEVVVTALGIKREKRALGYAVQSISGDQAGLVKSSQNFVNNLSGKVSGVRINRTTNFGGSTNVIIRGSTSLSGNNQALFVVDGVPIINRNTNTLNQSTARKGYDFGNTINDINPEDIASIEVLKGAAASVLYGSQASNGVIMITTKKGESAKGKGIAVTINSNISMGFLDRTTFPEYQNQYGAGYGAYYDGSSSGGKYWYLSDVDGDGTKDEYVPTSEDASYGAPFDGHQTYHWWSLYPQLDTYKKKGPWEVAKNGPDTFFQTPITLSNTVTLAGANDKGTYRLSYTNYNQEGAMPNAELQRNNISFGSNYKFNDKFSSVVSLAYNNQNVIGMNSTGYGSNILGGFRQWWQTNVDIKELKDAYDKTGENISWNPSNFDSAQKGAVPIYWDNPYYLRYQNYASMNRGRWLGNLALNYNIYEGEKFKTDVLVRGAIDYYGELQEERLSLGSNPTDFGVGLNPSTVNSGYLRRDIKSRLYNYDAIVNFSGELTDKIGLTGLIGGTIRRTYFDRITSSTNGGLKFPGIYSLNNSVDSLQPSSETASSIGRNSAYGMLSFDYDDIAYLEASLRRDYSSTLPQDNSTYYYPSISSSFVFTEIMPKNDILSFGKLRLNYAEVGSATEFAQLQDIYTNIVGLGGASVSVSNTKRNSNLKPERQKSIEGGLDLRFFNNKIGLDVGYYRTNTVNQIVTSPLSESTGYSFKVLNAGEIQNQGVEASLTFKEINLGPVVWSSTINWTKNVNKVVSLAEDLDNYQLGSFQGGVSINAEKGQPFGVIHGTDYVYDKNGQRIVDASNGQYIKTSSSDNVIGNQNPLWYAGFRNSFSYKRFDFSFLLDGRYGGDIFSLDMYYGLATGLYKETAFINDLGNPVRNTIEKGGGFINPGVNVNFSGEQLKKAREEGSTDLVGTSNNQRLNANAFGAQGYRRGLPAKAFVYDGSFIKLRELKIGYDIPVDKIVEKGLLQSAKLSLIGSNLLILYKNLPHADPEASLGSGNLQGYSAGSMPLFRQVSFDFTIKF